MPDLPRRFNLTREQARTLTLARDSVVAADTRVRDSLVRKGLAVYEGCRKIRLTQNGVQQREILIAHWRGRT